ncbi:protein of unknown function [bacterium A37T11]|nr:protein of unknown function [bacterium A37T11]
MKKIKNIGNIILLLNICSIIGCHEDKISPLEGSTNPPGQVSNVTVENLAGQAKVSYSLPKDQDLLYIKAVYNIRTGVSREVKSSYYANTLILDGFADTDEHEVSIYAVNRSEVASEPVKIIVKPLENPVWEVYRSLKILPDFAGVRITAENPHNANVALEIVKQDSLGKWEPFLPFIYSSQKQISQTTRGLEITPQKFGVTVRDRFQNYTDTLFGEITPFYEELLPKNLFKELRLPTDAAIQKVTAGIPLMWDGNNGNLTSQRMLTEPADPKPQWISIDLGQSAKLSRIKIWNYSEFMSDGNHQFYYRGQMRFFEIWGSENPNPDGSWDSWTKIGTFENIKPSGLPYGQNSAEDFAAGKAGFDYNFNSDAPKVRYLRFKNLQNWMGTTWFEILEINVYGDTR